MKHFATIAILLLACATAKAQNAGLDEATTLRVLNRLGVTTNGTYSPSGSSPTGAAGGDLSGTYPNPTVSASKISTGKLPVARGGSSTSIPLLSYSLGKALYPSVTEVAVGGFEAISLCFDGTYLWVSCNNGSTVSKVDPTTNTTVANITAGGSPYGICFDGSFIWVANAGDNTLSKINSTTNAVVATVPVGQEPGGMCFDGTYVWVTLEQDNAISKINVATNAVVATINVGLDPYGVCFDGTSIWVTNHGASTVSKINPTTNVVTATVTVGTTPFGICFDGAFVWCTNSGDNTLSKIDATTNTAVATVTVGLTPFGLCFDGTSVWTTLLFDGSVQRIDPKSCTVTGTIFTGKQAYNCCYDGSFIWATNSSFTEKSVNKIAVASLPTPVDFSTVSDGQVLIGSSARHTMSLGTITGTANQVISTVGSGTIMLSTPQNINTTSSPTFAALTLTAALTEANGGTNQSTYATGDVLYASAANTLSKLAGNATSTKKFLNQTGNGSASAAPTWAALVAADIPSLNASIITAGTLPIARGGTNASTASQNFAFIGPTSGAGAPSFRALVAGDIPSLNASAIGAGTLAVAQGGTNLASYAIGDILYASGTTTVAKLADVATGSVLISGGVTTAPAYSTSPSLANLTLSTGLTLTGATVTGAPTWGSSQAITLSTAAQSSITSLGTLTGLTVNSLIQGVDGTAGTALTVRGGNGSAGVGGLLTESGGNGVGTNQNAGGWLCSTGLSTGTGSADATIQSSFELTTGTTAQTACDRLKIVGRSMILSNSSASAQTICLASCAVSNSAIAGTIYVCLEANDGTNWDVYHDTWSFTAVNKAGTVTANATGAHTLVSTTANSGTLTDGSAGSVSVSGTNVQLKITPTWTVIVPTTVKVTYTIIAEGPTVLTPQ